MSFFLLASRPNTRQAAPVAPRTYRGDMGIYVAGAPDVGDGSPPGFVLSFMWPRYWKRGFRDPIIETWKLRGSLDVLLSWQDDAAYGLSLTDSLDARQYLIDRGLRPCEWLMSKTYMQAAGATDNAPLALAILEPTLRAFLSADCISRYCIASEANLWNTYASLQALINAVAPRVRAINRRLSVHFSTGYPDWRPDHPGSSFWEFWNPNVNKLTGGLWFQYNSDGSDQYLQDVSIPILSRFAGNAFVAPDCGLGYPFDMIGLEISLSKQFVGGMTQAEADHRGDVVLATPGQSGPAGVVTVMGSGNGQ